MELRKGTGTMTKNEQELLDIIRSSDNRMQAMITAIEIIFQYIKQHESSPELPAADPPVSP